MTDALRFNVAQLLKEPFGASRHIEVQVELFDLVPGLAREAPDLKDYVPILGGDVRLMHINTGILANGQLHADIQLACARCLEPTPTSLDIEVEEMFVPTIDVLTGLVLQTDEDDQALWIDEHHILDLTEVLRQDVVLNVPPHILCSAACRGLCPNCGQNRNVAACDCHEEPDARWAALTALLGERGTESSN